MSIRDGDPDAEAKARAALELLVDAFLIDRRANRDCFARAHVLGMRISRTFGCRDSFDPDQDHYVNACGVLALHNRFGLSPGGPTVGCCSICGAGDFECDHVPGRTYNGAICHRVVTEFDVREISLVRVPRDPRCFRIMRPRTRTEVEATPDDQLAPGELPVCRHCEGCSGRFGARDDDLDPSRWGRLPAEG